MQCWLLPDLYKADEIVINWIQRVWQGLKREESLVSVYLFVVDVILRLAELTLALIVYPFVPIKKNKIVISSFYGLGYGDNGKYIAEALNLSQHSYDIVWMYRRQNKESSGFPEFVRVVRYNSLIGFYELITARVWIDNCRKSFFTFKRDGQYYLQTWHSSLGIKMIEKDVADDLPKTYLYRAQRDSNMCDVILAGSGFRYELFKKSFWYNGEVMKSGTPRCDMLFGSNTHIVEKVYKSFGIPTNCHLILYAPTFRSSRQYNYELIFDDILATMEGKFGGDWRMLLRLHPNVSAVSNRIVFGSKVFNASFYADMQELISVSDCLITDYSSVLFDMLLAKKPCFIHAPDYELYNKQERGLYFNVSQLPFPFSGTHNQLLQNMSEFDKTEYLNKAKAFMDEVNFYEDGAASERVAQRISEIVWS